MTYRVRIVDTDVTFDCEPEQTVLDSALKAGIGMPYSCRKGVCGNCAGEVTTGEVDVPTSDVAAPGSVLYCQSRPRSNLEIRPTHWQRVEPSTRKTYDLKVYRNTLAAEDVSVLQLRLPTGQRARFRAGQYLQLLLPDGSRRAYSMANPPHENDALTLHIRHVPGGQFTQRVAGLAPGDLLSAELPFGSFALKEASGAPMLCVVGGTGFAPVKSLLDDMVRKAIRRPVTLLWGARDRRGLYMPAAVERWRKLWPDFHFVAAIEDVDEAAVLDAFQGRVDAALRAKFASLAGFEVYCCGGPPMVAAVRHVCVAELGLDARHFFSDVFVPGPAVET
jgi:NAD(P)H-flavin reductase/ferredoxin